MGDSFRVASIQLELRDNQTKSDRIQLVEDLIAKLTGAELVVLPEIWGTGYFNFEKYHQESETLDGETVSRMAELAKKKSIYLLMGSFVEKSGDGYYNTTVFLNPKGEIIGKYRKIHLFGYGSAESKALNAGTEIVVVKTDLGNFGISTCYDLRFPELYRRQVDEQAHCFLVSSAWPYPRLENWNMLNHVRAFENQAYLISSNCCGVNNGRQFLGHSKAVDPWGTAIASAGDFPTIVMADFSLDTVINSRAEFPALRDRVCL